MTNHNQAYIMYATTVGNKAAGLPEYGSHFTMGLVKHIKEHLFEPIPDILSGYVKDGIERKANF